MDKYFKIQELVSKRVYDKYGESAWKFIDIRLQETMLILREALDESIKVNTWHSGGSWQQRGLRENVSGIVSKRTKRNQLYLSAHTLGKALDFDVEGMTAKEVRAWIIDNADLFPYKIRLEAGVTWVHLDIIDEDKNPKIYKFNP